MTCQLCRGVSTAQRLSLTPVVPVDGTAGIPPSGRWVVSAGVSDGRAGTGKGVRSRFAVIGEDPACSGALRRRGVLPPCHADGTRSCFRALPGTLPACTREIFRDSRPTSAGVCLCQSGKRSRLAFQDEGTTCGWITCQDSRDGEPFPTHSEGTLSLGLRSLGRTFSLLRKEINVVFSISVTEGLSAFVSC